jgi:hypothetical protein
VQAALLFDRRRHVQGDVVLLERVADRGPLRQECVGFQDGFRERQLQLRVLFHERVTRQLPERHDLRLQEAGLIDNALTSTAAAETTAGKKKGGQ